MGVKFPWDTEKLRDYIGDGVYVAFDGFNLELRIEDHRNSESTICLEPDVLKKLIKFANRMGMDTRTEI